MGHNIRKIHLIFLVMWIGCGQSKQDPDIPSAFQETIEQDQLSVSDEMANTKLTFYHLKITFFDGERWEIDRDLSDKDPYVIYSFGSTHIAPAVSLMLHDTVYEPNFLIFVLNIGIVIGSGEHPVQCPSEGDYPFSEFPPSIRVEAKNMKFESTVKGATGHIKVTKWTTQPGEVFEGEFKGRLLFDTPMSEKPWIEVTGIFHLTLPEISQGE